VAKSPATHAAINIMTCPHEADHAEDAYGTRPGQENFVRFWRNSRPRTMTINLCDRPNWIRFLAQCWRQEPGFRTCVSRPAGPQVEAYGELKSVASIRDDKLTPYQNPKTIAQNIIGESLWLIEDLLRHGSVMPLTLWEIRRVYASTFLAQRGKFIPSSAASSCRHPNAGKIKVSGYIQCSSPKEKPADTWSPGATGSASHIVARLNESNESSRFPYHQVGRSQWNLCIPQTGQPSTAANWDLNFDNYANALRPRSAGTRRCILVAKCGDVTRVKSA